MTRTAFEILLVASTAIDAAVALLVLHLSPLSRQGGPPPKLLSAASALNAVVALAAAFLLKAPLLYRAGLDSFGLVHLAWLHLAVTLPGLSVLVFLSSMPIRGRRIRRVTAPAALLAVLGLAAGAAAWEGRLVEPFRLRLETTRVSLAPARSGSGEVRIGVRADIQTDRVTEHERGAVDRLMALSPDVIFLAGDLFQGWPGDIDRELPALRELVSRLHAPAGVFAVAGNIDRPEELRRILEGTGVRLLEDETARISIGDRAVTLAGIGIGFNGGRAGRVIREMETAPGESDIRIVLCHFPDVAFQMRPGSRVDLGVAGHTHGGQVCLAGLGPLITLSDVPRRTAAGGLSEIAGNRVYVSRGVGLERGQAPPVRFLCPPEVTLITLSSISSPGPPGSGTRG